MRRHSKLLLFVLLCLAVTSFGLWKWFGPLPHPHDAGMRDLARWLLQRDLKKEPREIQVSLVNRLQTELEADFALPSKRTWSSNSHEQLLQNIVFLGRVWFEERSTEYQQVNKSQRLRFLATQIAVVFRWLDLETELTKSASPENLATAAPAKSAGSTSESEQSTLRLFQRIQNWIDDAKGKQHVIFEQTVQDAVLCSLVTDDLSDQPMIVRRDLARRIADFLDEGGITGNNRLELEPAHYQRLSENGLVLMEALLINLALEFEPLSKEEKLSYVKKKLDQMNHWNLDNLFDPATAGQQNTTTKLLSRILPHLETWISRAEPAQQSALRSLIQAFQRQLFLDQFRK